MSRLPANAWVFALAALVSACATTTDSSADRPDRVYRTGSNLPVRDPSAISEVKTVDPSSLDKGMRNGMPGTVRGN